MGLRLLRLCNGLINVPTLLSYMFHPSSKACAVNLTIALCERVVSPKAFLRIYNMNLCTSLFLMFRWGRQRKLSTKSQYKAMDPVGLSAPNLLPSTVVSAIQTGIRLGTPRYVLIHPTQKHDIIVAWHSCEIACNCTLLPTYSSHEPCQ